MSGGGDGCVTGTSSGGEVRQSRFCAGAEGLWGSAASGEFAGSSGVAWQSGAEITVADLELGGRGSGAGMGSPEKEGAAECRWTSAPLSGGGRGPAMKPAASFAGCCRSVVCEEACPPSSSPEREDAPGGRWPPAFPADDGNGISS